MIFNLQLFHREYKVAYYVSLIKLFKLFIQLPISWHPTIFRISPILYTVTLLSNKRMFVLLLMLLRVKPKSHDESLGMLGRRLPLMVSKS